MSSYYYALDMFGDCYDIDDSFSIHMKTNKHFNVKSDTINIIKEAIKQNLMSEDDIKYCTSAQEIDKYRYYDSIKYGI